MAWRRSITSSDSSHNTPRGHVSISSDSSQSSYDSNQSGYHRRLIRNSRRIMARRPQSPPTPEESFEDEENVDPEGESEDFRGQPAYLQPPIPLQEVIPDEELETLNARFEERSSHTGRDGFGAGSSLAAELQHHLDLANSRVAHLETLVDSVALTNLRAIEEEHDVLIGQITDLTVQNVMMGVGRQAEADVAGCLWMAVVVLLVVVMALVLKAW